jgi:hypothetical protein
LWAAPFNQAEYEQLLRRVNNNSYNFYDAADGPYQQLLHPRHPHHLHKQQQQQQQKQHHHHHHQLSQQHLQPQKKQEEKARVRERKKLRQADQKPPVILVVDDEEDNNNNNGGKVRTETDNDDNDQKVSVKHSGMASSSSSSSPLLIATSPTVSPPSFRAPPPSPADLEKYFKRSNSPSPSPELLSHRSRSCHPTTAPPPTRNVSPLPLPPPMMPLLPGSSNGTDVHQGPSAKRRADAVDEGKSSTKRDTAAKKAKTHGHGSGSLRAAKKSAKAYIPDDDSDDDSEDDPELVMQSIENSDGCFPNIPSARSLAGCISDALDGARRRHRKKGSNKVVMESIENSDGCFPDIPSAHRPIENYDAYRQAPASIQSTLGRQLRQTQRSRRDNIIVSSDSDDEEYIPPRRQRSSGPQPRLTRAYRRAQQQGEQQQVPLSQAITGGVNAGEHTGTEGKKGQPAALHQATQRPTLGSSEPAPRQRPRASSGHFWPTVTFGVPSHWPRYLDMLMWSLRGNAEAVHQRLQELCRFEPPLSCEWVRLRLQETAVQHKEFVQRFLPGEAGTAARVRVRSALFITEHNHFFDGPGTDRTPLPSDAGYAALPPLPEGAPSPWTRDLDRVVREAVLARRTPAETVNLLQAAAENNGQALHGLSHLWIEVRMAQSEWLLLDP